MAELARSFFTFALSFLCVSFGSGVLSTREAIQSPSSIRYFLYQSAQYPHDCQEVYDQCTSKNAESGVYVIKPDQYPEPFQVYCDNNFTSGGWTSIQRRYGGSINFARTWNDYKFGFGYLGSEFWMGNEKLTHLTNQKRYKIRIDVENTDGQSYYIAYDNFRISDEWDGYSLLSLQASDEITDLPITWCVTNNFNNNGSACERSCENPNECIPVTASEPERCICPENYMIHGDNCIPKEQCGCYDQDNKVVIGKGESHLQSGCSVRLTCPDNRLIMESYRCGDDASCEERDGVGRCTCNEWFEGDGITCTRRGPLDCYDLYLASRTVDMVYRIYPKGSSGFHVYCEMSNGGWTILQKQTDNSINFNRGWNAYKNGFGNSSGDYWLGNDKMHILTKQKTYKLKIEKTNAEGAQYYTEYSHFEIGNIDQNYELMSLGDYSGTSGNNAMAASEGAQFSTHNNDNDGSSTFNCAEKHGGGWWYPDDTSTGTTEQCYSFNKSVASGRYETQYSDCDCYYYCNEDDDDSGDYYSGCFYYDCGHTFNRPHLKCVDCDGCSGSYDFRCCRNKEQVEVHETNFYSCGSSNLNGDYQFNDYRGMFWKNLQGSDCGITSTTMKIRPV